MYTAAALLDLHDRAHRSLRGLIAHARTLTADELNRDLAGFGYPSVRIQLIHEIGAEEYWLGVIHGRIDAEDKDNVHLTLDAVEGWRTAVFAAMETYLKAATPEELNTPRPMKMWTGKEAVMMPARIVVRTAMHLFHHQGQILAMCRLLGKPTSGGLDFPIV